MNIDEMSLALKKYLRPATELFIEEQAKPPKKAGLTRLGGNSDLGSLPSCKSCGKVMTFVCQINLPEFDQISLPAKFLDFHYCFECMPWDTSGLEEGSAVIRLSDELPVLADPGHSYSVSKGETWNTLPSRDGMFRLLKESPDIPFHNNLTLSDPEYMEMIELYQSALDALDAWVPESSHIGGWPLWVQGDDTPADMKLLLQLDDLDSAAFQFGDVGSLYLFYSDDKEFGMKLQTH